MNFCTQWQDGPNTIVCRPGFRAGWDDFLLHVTDDALVVIATGGCKNGAVGRTRMQKRHQMTMDTPVTSHTMIIIEKN